jgi:hypothetical protein
VRPLCWNFLPLRVRDGLRRDLMPVGGKENGKLFTAATFPSSPCCYFQIRIHEVTKPYLSSIGKLKNQ